ncbi:cytochrome c family protein [Magnetococcus sp. PR-3]|uniref:cytochrome c family protein n=1 Tax=Magnetococcus sp. PR-3 TaxID=3120355 RepID=UPI002FCE03FE
MRPSVWTIQRLIAFTLTTLFFTLLAPTAQATMVEEKQVPINHISAETCKACHEGIYKQWKGSMHAQSTAAKDPIHNAFYRKVIGDPNQEDLRTKKGTYPVCLKCHVPNLAVEGKTKLDANPVYAEGVNCVACHRIKAFKGIRKPGKPGLTLGIDAYELGNTLSGPSGILPSGGGDDLDNLEGMDEAANPHLEASKGLFLPLEGKNRLFRTADACMGCHDQRNNGHGVPLCQTGNEYNMGASKVTCQTCHMPNTDGVANHDMGGGHNMGMLKRAVILDLDVKQTGPQLLTQIYLENLQPHSMPTGAPFRNMFLTVTAFNADGDEVWKSTKGHPSKDDPNAYFHLVLLDGKGKPTIPPKAKGVGPDSRLKPFEKRMLNYQIPAQNVASIRAELHYNLLWPGINKAMAKVLPEDVREAKLIAHAQWKSN